MQAMTPPPVMIYPGFVEHSAADFMTAVRDCRSALGDDELSSAKLGAAGWRRERTGTHNGHTVLTFLKSGAVPILTEGGPTKPNCTIAADFTPGLRYGDLERRLTASFKEKWTVEKPHHYRVGRDYILMVPGATTPTSGAVILIVREKQELR